jgi:outer membrane immunogenic protein
MNFVRTIAFACAVAAIASSAQADGPPPRGTTTTADPYAYTPPPEQLFYNWSGFYFGGHLGGLWSTTRSTLTTVAAEPNSNSGSDFIGGIQGGYQFQIRELVLGAEVKHSWTGFSTSFPSLARPGLNVATSVNDVTTVSGRLGYAYMNLMAYAKAGWATAGIDYTASGVATGTGSTRGNGWTAGVGVAYALGPNLIAGVEYDFVRINADGGVLAPAVTQSGTGVDLQSVMLRLDFKFAH